jgi:hypothetical protein
MSNQSDPTKPKQQKPMQKIQFFHFRMADLNNQDHLGNSHPFPDVGACVCYLPVNGISFMGVSLCVPPDNYNKKTAANKAKGMAERCQYYYANQQLHTPESVDTNPYNMMTMNEARAVAIELVRAKVERAVVRLEGDKQNEIAKITAKRDSQISQIRNLITSIDQECLERFSDQVINS